MKKQLIVLWIGIGMVVLALLFPPDKDVGGFVFLTRVWFVYFREFISVLFQLIAELLIIVLLTAGALYTLKKTGGK